MPERLVRRAAGGTLAAAVIAASVLAEGTQAQESPGDRVAGKQLAVDVCSECHLVSPDQLFDPMTGAPPFQEVADRPSTTEIRLRVFFRNPHENMPDLMLTPEETDNIIAYILSLKRSE